jgi:hypothetical protein
VVAVATRRRLETSTSVVEPEAPSAPRTDLRDYFGG